MEAIYAGRFVALPWKHLERLAEVVFPDEGRRRLAQLQTCWHQSDSDPRTLSSALRDYVELMRRGPGALEEETGHHAALVATPMWALLNAAALCERLHLVGAQHLYSRPRRTPALRRALGHALRLHVFRQYLHGQMWAVVETLFHLPHIVRHEKPVTALNDFELAYGDEAGMLAQALQEMVYRDGVAEGLPRCRQILLASLDPAVLPERPWTRLLDRGLELLEEEWRRSRLALAALRVARSPAPPAPPRPLRFQGLLLDYLLATRGGGLAGTLARMAFTSFLWSLIPLGVRLFRRDPYSVPTGVEHETFSVPGLRSYLSDGRDVIIDPATVTGASRRIGHPGMENLLLPGESGYAVDQFLLRRAVQELLGEPKLSRYFEDFIRSWTALDQAGWKEFESLLAEVRGPAERFVGRCREEPHREAIGRGQLTEELLKVHLEARESLVARLRQEEAREGRRWPVRQVLHAHYMHGL